MEQIVIWVNIKMGQFVHKICALEILNCFISIITHYSSKLTSKNINEIILKNKEFKFIHYIFFLNYALS